MTTAAHVLLPREVVEQVRVVLDHYATHWEHDCGDAAHVVLTALDQALSAPEPFADHGNLLSIAGHDGMTIGVYADDACHYITLANQHGVGVGGVMVDSRDAHAVALALLAAAGVLR